MFLKRIMGLLLFICNGPFLFSQNIFTIYNSSNSPLPDNNVQSLAVDRFGKKWVGTDLGLAVYDNTNWTIYTASNSGLPNNSVRAIAFDDSDNAWIGTYFGGLAKFDGSTWTVYTSSNSGLPSDFAKSIAFDSTGNVWVGTDFGFAKFDGSAWTLWNSTNSVFVSDNIPALRINRKNDKKYIGTINGGFAEMDAMNNITLYNNSNSNLVDNTTWAIAIDTAGYQCLAFPSDGFMIHYVANTWQWYNAGNSNIPSNSVYDICVDSLNVKYLGTLGGLARYDGNNWTTWDTATTNIPDNFVNRVIKERNGTIWVGTPNGLAKMVEPSGITDFNKEDLFQLFPDPNDGTFTITSDTKQFSLSVFDLTGQVQFRQDEKFSSRELHLDLVPGIYFVEVTGEKGRSTQKMIVY